MISKIKTIANNTLCSTLDFASKYSRILLALILCIASMFSFSVIGANVSSFRIFDGKTTKIVHLLNDSPEQAVRCVTLESGDYEIVDTKNEDGYINVTVNYSFPVYIAVGDEIIEVMTVKSTVKEILEQVGFKVDKYDLLDPSADTVIDSEAIIQYSDVEYVKDSYTESVPCKTKTVYSSKKLKGTKTFIKGEDGKKKVTYTNKVVNGNVVSITVEDVTVLSNAVSNKEIVGTGAKKSKAVTTSKNVKTVSVLSPKKAIKLDKSGAPVNYKKKITVEATGYTYTGHRCSTGVSPKPGYIAVNPRYIPYGTKMYIRSKDGRYNYGYAIAADTGGFVKSRPTNVDLFFASRSACVAFGRRDVEIFIIG